MGYFIQVPFKTFMYMYVSSIMKRSTLTIHPVLINVMYIYHRIPRIKKPTPRWHCFQGHRNQFMVTLWYGNAFHITSPLCGGSTGYRFFIPQKGRWCGALTLIWDNLTQWGRVTHICVGNLAIIGSDNGLSPRRCQAIIWTNAEILLIEPLAGNKLQWNLNRNLLKRCNIVKKKFGHRPFNKCSGHVQQNLVFHQYTNQKHLFESTCMCMWLWIKYLGEK